MKDDTVRIRVEIPVQTLRDLLCTAVEGGSNYWAKFLSAKRTPDLDYLQVRLTEHEAGNMKGIKVVTAEDLALGIERLAKIAAENTIAESTGVGVTFSAAGKHFADALGDHDAITADVVLQMTIFGEVVYG